MLVMQKPPFSDLKYMISWRCSHTPFTLQENLPIYRLCGSAQNGSPFDVKSNRIGNTMVGAIVGVNQSIELK
jgi:hypothetical protein